MYFCKKDVLSRHLIRTTTIMNKVYLILISMLSVILHSCIGGSKQEVVATDSLAVEDITEPVLSEWQKDYFVDEFGEKSNAPEDAYAYIETDGDFSNSATTGSHLTVRILATPNQVRFNLFEYGSQMVKGEGILHFKAKLPNDSIIEFKTYNQDNGANFVDDFYSTKPQEILALLEKYEMIKFSGKTTDSPISTYRFTLQADTTSLKRIMSQFKNHEN